MTDRRNARIAGILLLVGFAGVVIAPLTGTVLGAPDVLAAVPGHEGGLVGGAIAELVMAFACSGIVVFLYPALRRVDAAWATWSLVLRSFEAVLVVAATVTLLSLPALGRAAHGADAAGLAALGALATTLRDAHQWLSGVLAILAWSLGALVYHVLFLKGRLVPRWLAVWGIVGAPLAVASCVLATAEVAGVDSAANTLLNLPLGLQEIPLAVWLIARGTRSPAEP